MKMYLHHYFIW